MFASPETLLNPGLSAYLCGSFAMPNSQATLLNFWEPAAEPIVIDGTPYDTAADALLAELGIDRSGCADLETVSNCNRSENPDDLCGNAFSGKACNRITGRCVPELTLDSPSQPAGPASSVVAGAPNGVCKTDGSRGCPYPETCEPANEVMPGIEGFDGVCVP
jgi:hypothetical protein